MNKRASCALVAAAGLLGCSTPDGAPQDAAMIAADSVRRTARAAQSPTLLRTLPWLQDFELGSHTCRGETWTQQQTAFAGGEIIHLSMRVNDAPRGTVITTYWYGPGNESLGYEKKTIPRGQDRLRFIRDDTRGWREGAYHVEVWVGDIKLRAMAFDMMESGMRVR